ncbi:hypothetical protein [Streptomyces sp. NPDC050164]|uniref:hypothetical protein n=1 Tax=Streptomyces sp. NPDC050164 TaxID=3365605 RepID=UPI0037960C02
MTAATAQRHPLLHMTANGSLGPEGEDLLVVRRGEGPYVEDADGSQRNGQNVLSVEPLT